MVKIALAQDNFWVGDIEGNSRRIIEHIQEARKNKVDIIAFPELALVGYPPQDLLHKKYFIKKNKDAINSIAKTVEDIIAIVGFVNSSDDSGDIYNSYAFMHKGKISDVYNKINLPNYGVFDEKRYFKPGRDISVYSFKGYSFSVNICEDIWRKDYVKLLMDKNLDFIINVSASPFHMGKLSTRKEILSYTARQAKCFVFYCNLVGGQDGLVFDGKSMVVSPEGKIVKAAARFEEDLLVSNFPLRAKAVKETQESQPETSFEALSLGIKDYVRKNGFKKVVVGVSGGIDSAVVVSLAALSLGKGNVYALIMPSRYTSKGTFRDALRICRNLGIKCSIVPIDNIFNSYMDSLKELFKGYPADKTEENIQARIRGNILMAFSNKFGYLVANTGNKSELSCGYCTLYGDMVGGFGVLSDIPKTLVYKLANYINRKVRRIIIPLSVIKRPPSAELRFNQKDSDTLPSYDILDDILRLYIEEDLYLDDIVNRGIKRSLVKKVINMVDKNEYKRRQAPPGIKITPKAFGRDRRMPITNKFSP
ncbi:MAG: NAD+ synthase [Candidatus Omnitrophica bacterium 4484_171]|nr:MAG: NAD+ synthase [Candidatus Omnitrophica bacterium 4484_171]